MIDQNRVTEFHPRFFCEVDFTKLRHDQFRTFVSSIGDCAQIEAPSFLKAFNNYHTQCFKDSDYYSLEPHLLSKLTLEQLEALGKASRKVKGERNFIGSLFRKQFHAKLDPERIADLSLEERRDDLVEMFEASKGQPDSLRNALLFEILALGPKLDVFDKAYFQQYLKRPLQTWFLNSRRHGSGCHDGTWDQYLGSVQAGRANDWDGLQTLYMKYLEHFHREDDLKGLAEHFEKDWWQRTMARLDFLAGKEVPQTDNLGINFEDLAKEVMIELVDANRPVFRPEERVRLVVELKNVPQLFVNIYEFNSENYYRKTMAPFRTDVNLDGLVASHEERFEFDERAQVKFRHVFDFPQLDNRVGLFVIECIGNGYSSRAVVKKGTLSLVSRATAAGHVAYILDEDRNICRGRKTGIWFDENLWEADEAGRILIPYTKHARSGKSILIHDEFAQLADFERMTETYSLSCSFVLHPEALLMSTEASLLVRPTLTVNGRPCDLGLLKNVKAKLTTTSFIDNIPVTKTFDRLELSSSQELELSFQVPPNLDRVDVEVEAELTNVTRGDTEKFRSSQAWNLRTHKQSHQFYDYFLRKLRGEYVFLMLGKNGEPQDDVQVNFEFGHRYMNKRFESGQRTTDAEGRVHLGALPEVYSVTANVSSSNGHQNVSWTLAPAQEVVSYPSSINVLEGETVELPFSGRELSAATLAIVRHSADGGVIENCRSKASLELPNGFVNGTLKVAGLEAGRYTLKLLELGTEIHLVVHRGVYWETDSFILKPHSLVELRENQNYVRLSDLSVSEPVDNKQKIRLRVSGHKSAPRVHFYAFQFLPNNVFEVYRALQRDQNAASLSVFKFHKWSNFFLSNRKLGDEFRYVFDRKYLPRFMGNTLDRPMMLLKRAFVRDTSFNEEVVHAGQQFEQMQEVNQLRDYDLMTQQIAGAPADQYMRRQQCVADYAQERCFSGSNTNYNGHTSLGQLLYLHENNYLSF